MNSGNVIQKGGAIVSPILAGIPEVSDLFGAIVGKPKSFSLREKMPSAGKQENWDCVGWAGAYLKEFLEQEETGKKNDLSGLYIYAMAKKIDGYELKGTYINMATYIPVKYGVCEEYLYPERKIDSDPDLPEPIEEAHRNALQFKNKESVMVDRGSMEMFDGITDTLWNIKKPIVVGAQWYEWDNKTGEVKMPKGLAKFGHAVVVTGYNEKGLEFLNSWGKEWGDEGYGRYPYGYPIFSTCWTAVDLSNDWQEKKVQGRDLAKEQRIAIMIREMIYTSFAEYDRVRTLAAKLWFDLINAVAYNKYTLTDIKNYLYSLDRTGNKLFNLSEERK